VLHVIRYRHDALDALIDAINATGYGLTFGLHTRLDATIAHVTGRIRAGNLYINRNVIGAVVGVQPFGGCGLSGTGPKAGGPHYLGRLVRTAPLLPGQADSPTDPALDAFVAWLDAKGEAAAAAIARKYGDRSPLGQVSELAGPVGERNLYALHARGHFLLKPMTPAGLYQQIAATLASGGTATIEDMPVPDVPASVATRIGHIGSGRVAGVLVEGNAERVRAVTRATAALSGPIALVHAASPAECAAALAYPPEWLLEEVSTSINTTAAGGNASLMAIA
jgi:RHH-type proline utilization regulon transcriptional repressor/proline dehydrogenase/delta 1-pyrroline-5-carboxylate dehydrogenase